MELLEMTTMRRLMILILVLIVLCGVIGGWAYSRGGQSKNTKGSGNGLETACVHPGYGEFNSHILSLAEENVSLHVGESTEISGTVEGKAFFVGNETCHYSGNVTLRAYLGPGYPKDSWGYMSGKLKSVEGLKVKITSGELRLEPNETVGFRVEITPQKSGTYYLYIVASGGKGWKSWDVIEVEVR